MIDSFPLDSFLKKSTLESSPVSNVVNDSIASKPNESPSNFSKLELDEISKSILKQIKSLIPLEKYNAFFATTFYLKDVDSSNFYFDVSSGFIKKMVTEYYTETVIASVRATMGQAYGVVLSVNGDVSEQEVKDDNYNIKKAYNVKDTSFTINDFKILDHDLAHKVDNVKIERMVKKHTSSIALDKRKLFSNFIVGPSNNLAHASAVAVAKSPGEVYPAIYFHGNSGLGKTHLLHAVGNLINEHSPNKTIHITTANDFTNDMVEAIKAKDMGTFRRKYTVEIDVLMIDDVHELKNRPSTQNEFFHIFNELVRKKKQLLFTSDKDPREINGLEDRIRTRLSSALVVEIQQPDLETRIAILRRKALEENIYLPDDVVNLIASCIKSNIRELEGSLIKLGAYSSVFNVDIDIDTAKEQLNLNPADQLKTINMETITKTVSGYFRIPVPDIRSKARNRDITNARHIAMYFSYKIGQSTLTQIGDYFGKRDHTSVMHGVNKVKNLVKNDNDFAHRIFEIESQL